jgi:hypothetical protein
MAGGVDSAQKLSLLVVGNVFALDDVRGKVVCTTEGDADAPTHRTSIVSKFPMVSFG